jgi:hypothetical protein
MSSSRTRVETVLHTLEHERHTREALLVAFADDLRAAAPESTRTLTALAKAERGQLDDGEFADVLEDLRAIVYAA